MSNKLFRGAEGLGVLFIVLAVLALFLITTTNDEIARIYIFFILFGLIFVVGSLLSHTKKSSTVIPSFNRIAPFLISPIIAHITNNAIIVSTVNLSLDIIYPIILIVIFIALFYKIFQGTMKKSTLLVSVGIGFGFGFILTSQSVIGGLGVPILYAVGTEVAYTVFLLGIMAAVTEEIVFRGILFPLFFRAGKHEEALSALLFGAGAIIIFMSDFQIVGWILIALAIIEFLNKEKQLLGKSKIGRFVVAAGASSAIFAAFHVKVMNDPNMLMSAFIFGLITCSMVYWLSKGDL